MNKKIKGLIYLFRGANYSISNGHYFVFINERLANPTPPLRLQSVSFNSSIVANLLLEKEYEWYKGFFNENDSIRFDKEIR